MTKFMAAHQPNFLPYLGFFDKMRAVNELGTEPGVFVVRDDCQFVRKDFQNRNRIRTYSDWMWLQVPVNDQFAPIRDIKIIHSGKINGRENWIKFHKRMIWNNYRRTPFFEKFYPVLDDIYSDSAESLRDFNFRIISYLAGCFGIKTKTVFASELGVSGRSASETLAKMARAVGADAYLSGPGGREYLDISEFGSDVKVLFQKYNHPVYPQRFPGFQPCMSAIDALFNIGYLPKSGEIFHPKKQTVKIETNISDASRGKTGRGPFSKLGRLFTGGNRSG